MVTRARASKAQSVRDKVPHPAEWQKTETKKEPDSGEMGDLTIDRSTRWGIDSARGNSRDVRMALVSSSMSSGTSCGRS